MRFKPLLFSLIMTLMVLGPGARPALAASQPDSVAPDFTRAADEFQVPRSLLLALCYTEGRLSMNKGKPSIDGGYGCMHLVKNPHYDTLDQAAQALKISPQTLQHDLSTNLRGGAWLLQQDARTLSPDHTVPSSLAGWYGAVARYSHSSDQYLAKAYADEVYQIIQAGFEAPTDSGEMLTLQSQIVQPDTHTLTPAAVSKDPLPNGCKADGKTDYPGAIDCILDPKIHDCTLLPDNAPHCNYFEGNRPKDYLINYVVSHDIEGSAISALYTFSDPNTDVSSHYVIDTEGRVYQVLHEKDIAFHDGNLWSNRRSIGIEHAGFAATGYLWYNTKEYLASAKLVAYLAKKYHISLDHDHILGHATVPSSLVSVVNHSDPGPYWLWDYYIDLISKQNVKETPLSGHKGVLTLTPESSRKPFGKNGHETPANFNYFYIYNGPATNSGIASIYSATDVTDVTSNIEPRLSYTYTKKVKDPAGTGQYMYQVWFGIDQPKNGSDGKVDHTAHAIQGWLAAPANAVIENKSYGRPLKIKRLDGKPVAIYSRPDLSSSTLSFVIGDAPVGSTFVTTTTTVEAGTKKLWYSINYNHRQAWVPAENITLI